MRRTRALTAAAAVTFGAGTLALATPAAAAAPAVTVACGDVIEGDVVLTADLICPTSPIGLKMTIGATLDLGGHRIVGAGQRPGTGESPTRTGIEIPPQGGVTIRGGTVQGWVNGVSPVEFFPGEGFERGRATLDGVTLRDNHIAVWSPGYVGESPEFMITSSRIVGNDLGISSWSAPRIFVESSRIVDNEIGASSSAGGGGISFVESVVARNETGLRCDDGGFTVEGSTLRDNGTAVRCNQGSVMLRTSTVARNDVGVTIVFDSYVELSDNVLRDNGTAVRLSNTYGTVATNRFVGNDVAYVGVGDWAVVTLEDNEFRRNGDGILSVADGTPLARNAAVRNERWGIHAPGAVDLGGNTARGNGNEPQCVGVVCESSGPSS